MDRQIVCFAIPTVEVALAQLHDPRLTTRPLTIALPNKARALIQEVSSEATQAGVAAGMSIDHARRICPSLQVLAPNPSRLHSADESLLKVVARYAPAWELSQPGAFLMDVTGMGRLFGSAADVAAKVQQETLEQYPRLHPKEDRPAERALRRLEVRQVGYSTPRRLKRRSLGFWRCPMNTIRSLVLGMTTVSLLSGCAPSLSEKAKLLAATQECGGGDTIAQHPEDAKAYKRCIQLQLDAMAAQEAAYERRHAEILAGLSKAFEPADR